MFLFYVGVIATLYVQSYLWTMAAIYSDRRMHRHCARRVARVFAIFVCTGMNACIVAIESNFHDRHLVTINATVNDRRRIHAREVDDRAYQL